MFFRIVVEDVVGVVVVGVVVVIVAADVVCVVRNLLL